MRILFSGNPQVGHLLPMMPLADAGRAAGHETALLTSGDLASLVAPVRVLQAGPSTEEMIDETLRRTGSHPSQPVPQTMELFAGVRVELSFVEAMWAVELYAGLPRHARRRYLHRRASRKPPEHHRRPLPRHQGLVWLGPAASAGVRGRCHLVCHWFPDFIRTDHGQRGNRSAAARIRETQAGIAGGAFS
jgi:hypothetical protein